MTIEIGAEIKSAVGSINVGYADMGLGCRCERGLVGQRVEIAGTVGAVGDVNIGIALQKGLGLTPAGHSALGGLEGHSDHGNGAAAVLYGLKEAPGTFGGVSCGGGGQAEEVPEFNHLEIGTTEGLEGGDGPCHATLEREKDIFVGVGDLLGVVPVAIGRHAVNVVFEG